MRLLVRGSCIRHCRFSTSHRRLTDFIQAITGVIGLAVARSLALRSGGSVILRERNRAVGIETSSRSSEVIHAGIYYGPGTLKTQLCIRGKKLLRIGKWIVAQNDAQRGTLEKLHALCWHVLDVPVNWISEAEMAALEPDVTATAGALESPTTGILDSHTPMMSLLADVEDVGGTVALRSKAADASPLRDGAGWNLLVQGEDGQEITIRAVTVVNAAGLGAALVHNLVLPPEQHIQMCYAKGNYFSYNASTPKVSRLIYPAPEPGHGGLGTHLTLDLAGRMRFGPDVEWCEGPDDVDVSPAKVPDAIREMRKYLPGIDATALSPDYAGIRPKLSRDSAIEGIPGWVNLLAIESPGLMSSLAIAEMVESLLYK
ncbi:FAD dependent oxidoreductase [Lasiosphaeris hirsuta]|uniref:L-2-hydroxyglutarate dehydrogenase, mitochondrial n=1 Tax=Lasiosphaeris hirsuta TaxID=260670 RepID=A0AA40DIL3_9PEZI|nr:FAD dependent oxidoreductase [Lasiosphaeris hirsuta]